MTNQISDLRIDINGSPEWARNIDFGRMFRWNESYTARSVSFECFSMKIMIKYQYFELIRKFETSRQVRIMKLLWQSNDFKDKRVHKILVIQHKMNPSWTMIWLSFCVLVHYYLSYCQFLFRIFDTPAQQFVFWGILTWHLRATFRWSIEISGYHVNLLRLAFSSCYWWNLEKENVETIYHL